MRRLALLLALVAAPALAVEPDEVLDDPALEARARALSQGLRCLVCRNESIDESNAGIARDLRLLVRERLELGDDDAAVIDYVVARYGEYVLLAPRADGSNLLLWGMPLLLLLIGGGFAVAAIARQRGTLGALSAEEEAQLAELMDGDEPRAP
ncbi:cytochrome c-type biogenesis protein [Jannaschia sp. W003]|uniref:cytochrome c-type biogenesis protein n=1 Tax=Jannaschia sp. W003 TaxID=2867012 RepID=UPI0021A3359D|nr:cytochrome c-type biogenesis protein [Jannaschia sp. W003]UWQ21018.1 cytochrome c-type biogenesis protein CcmH [Jannaschia sp. W003]